jgi:hypothetical protein
MVLAFNLAGDGLRDLLDPRTLESTPGLERRFRVFRRHPRNRPAEPATPSRDLPVEEQPLEVRPGP